MWQANWVVEHLAEHMPNADIEIIEITTRGDRTSDLTGLVGMGHFTSELEAALRHYDSARFVSLELSNERSAAASAVLRKSFPGSIERIRASARGLREIEELSRATGVRLTAEEHARIREIIQSDDFEEIVRA